MPYIIRLKQGDFCKDCAQIPDDSEQNVKEGLKLIVGENYLTEHTELRKNPYQLFFKPVSKIVDIEFLRLKI